VHSGRRDKAVLILNLGKRWCRSGQLHTLANLNLKKKKKNFTSKIWGESQRQFGHLGEEKSAIPARYQSLGLLSTLLLFDF
jgi:hypothetical protein